MGTIQSILTIGGIILLTLLMLSYYKNEGTHTSISLENEAIITGTGVAQSMLDEIQGKAFDEKTLTTSVSNPNDLSSSLGKDSGELNPSTFDDVDDYNNCTIGDTLAKLGVFTSSIRVHYINNMDPGTITITKTFSKRIDISVVNNYLTDTVKLSQVISY